MENVGGILGVAVAIALGAYFRSKHPAASWSARAFQFVLILVVAAVAGGAASIGGRYLRSVTGSPSKADIDKAMSTIRQMPLLGLVISENPGLETKLREVAEAEVRNPSKSSPSPLWLEGLRIRKQFIIPALRNTDDASAVNAMNAMRDLFVHFQAKNVATCNEIGKIGVQRPDKFDAEASAIFKHSLAAAETAYRNGRSAPPRRETSDEEYVQALIKAGYTEQDFDKLRSFEKLSDAEACGVWVKLFSAPSRLPIGDGGRLARYLLTASD